MDKLVEEFHLACTVIEKLRNYIIITSPDSLEEANELVTGPHVCTAGTGGSLCMSESLPAQSITPYSLPSPFRLERLQPASMS